MRELIRASVCMRTKTSVCMRTKTSICMRTKTNVCMSTRASVYMSTCVCTSTRPSFITSTVSLYSYRCHKSIAVPLPVADWTSINQPARASSAHLHINIDYTLITGNFRTISLSLTSNFSEKDIECCQLKFQSIPNGCVRFNIERSGPCLNAMNYSWV